MAETVATEVALIAGHTSKGWPFTAAITLSHGVILIANTSLPIISAFRRLASVILQIQLSDPSLSEDFQLCTGSVPLR